MTQLTDEQAGAVAAEVQRLAAEGNGLAAGLQRRLEACETPAERAALLAQTIEEMRRAGPAIAAAVNGVASTLQRALGPALTRFMAQATPILQGLHEATWSAYRAAGAPYGESEEGLRQWIATRSASSAPAATEGHD